MKCIELTRGFTAIVDDEDFEWLAKWRWKVQPNGYVARAASKVNGRHKTVLMHRAIMGCESPVDHINGDKLDNRRCNLRPATHSQNGCNRGKQKNNTTGFKGVFRKRNAFRAQIVVQRRAHHIGTFKTEEDAYAAYKSAASKLHGEFARLH